MFIDVNIERNIVTISGKEVYRGTIQPNIGMLATIIKTPEELEMGRYVTGRDGIWKIVVPLDQMHSGRYEKRFYGSKTIQLMQPQGDWESFLFQNPLESAVEQIIFKTTPMLQVSEGREISTTDINGNERTEVLIDLMNLETSQGRIAYVETFYKNSDENDYKWRILDSFAFDENLENVSLEISGVQNTQVQYRSSIILDYKPINYDFYCIFYNPFMEVALNGNAPLKVFDEDVLFNGIPDLEEYVEVPKLQAINCVDPEGGSLPGTWVLLEWEDLKILPNITSSEFPRLLKNGYTGSGVQVTYNMAQTIYAYGVWMYVSDVNETPPIISGIEGMNPVPADFAGWYFMGDFTSPNASIQCPKSKWVGFWVGMKTKQTEAIKGVSGIQKVKYIN